MPGVTEKYIGRTVVLKMKSGYRGLLNPDKLASSGSSGLVWIGDARTRTNSFRNNGREGLTPATAFHAEVISRS